MYSARHKRRLISKATKEALKRCKFDECITETPSNSCDSYSDTVQSEAVNIFEESSVQNKSFEEPANDEPFGGKKCILTELPIAKKLQDWALGEKIPLKSTSKLLKILRKEVQELKDLPNDARTLLKTPKTTQARSVPPGSYIHFGLENNLVRLLSSMSTTPTALCIDLSTDGLPITKSSHSQFWPIQGRICTDNSSPFFIGIFHGYSKPQDCNVFLRELVDELKELMERGLVINGQVLSLKIRCIIADAPARSFILNSIGHSGYFGCGKCQQRGFYYKNRIVYESSVQPLRSDDSFVQQSQAEHHNGNTILSELPIGLVSQVPVEYMHLVLLGVTKRLLSLWTHAKRHQCRWSYREIIEVSRKISETASYIPVEFSRKPRPLSELSRWKCTEIRLFLLYLSPSVLKTVLKHKYFKHFMCFQVAIYILCSKSLMKDYVEYARSLLTYFVRNFQKLYGREQLSYNIHNLLHLVDDAKKFGPLDSFSAFPYENNLQVLKSLVRGNKRPLQQVHRRIQELNNQNEELHNVASIKNPSKKPGGRNKTFVNNFQVAGDKANCHVRLKSGKIVKLKNVFKSKGGTYVRCVPLEIVSSAYNIPCDSQKFGIAVVASPRTVKLQTWPLEEIDVKCVAYPINDNQLIAIPLLHSQ